MKVNNFDWTGVRVLVTGASGFKGAWLCAALLEMGANVYGTVRNKRHPFSSYRILEVDQRIGKIGTDITNKHQVRDLINSVKPDVIFHLAAKALVQVSNRDPGPTYEANLLGTMYIIEACRELRIGKKLIIISTDHVFGVVPEKEFPASGFKEDHPIRWGDPYGTSKVNMENMVRSQQKTYGSKLPNMSISRAANVYGMGDINLNRVIPFFISSALKEGNIPLRYRLPGRQFIHITDVIAGYIKLASTKIENKSNPGVDGSKDFQTPVFHFGTSCYPGSIKVYIQIEHLGRIIASLFKAKLVETPDCKDFPSDENPFQGLNCNYTMKRLNWQPRKPLEEGLLELGKWYSCQNQKRTLLQKLVEKDVEQILVNVEAEYSQHTIEFQEAVD